VSTGTYTPGPGTLGARAIDALREQTEPVSNTMLAALIGAPASAIQAGLATVLANNLVRKEMRDGRIFWSIGDGTQAPAPRVATAFDLAPKLRTQPPADEPDNPPEDAEAAQAPACDEGERATPNDGALPAGDVTDFVRQLAGIEGGKLVGFIQPRPARFALWNDGALEIRRDGAEPLVLAVDDTKRLLRYLERLAVEEGA
jgi:hypothetical protein